MTTQIDYQVEPRAVPGRYTVKWDLDGKRYWFPANIEGDQIVKVLPAGRGSLPSVGCRPLNDIHAYNTYLVDADAAVFILDATRYIRTNKLATQARQASDDRKAALAAARIAETATRVRQALTQTEKEFEAIAEALGLQGLRQYQREGLISVGSLDDAFLFRVASILGCD